MPTDFTGGSLPQLRRPGTARPLNEPARPMFQLTHHPARWHEVDGELLPLLGRMSHQRGVNNVDHHGDTTRAEVNLQKEGWTILPLEACPAELTPDNREGYVRVYQGRGPIHVTAWEKPRPIGSRVVWERDEPGYHAWLRYLMAEGYIAAPDPVVIDALREQLQAKRDRQAARADVNHYAKADVAKIDDALVRLDEAWAKIQGAPEPVKRKRGKR